MLYRIIIIFLLSFGAFAEDHYVLPQEIIDQANTVFKKMEDLKNNMRKRHDILLKKIEKKKATIQEIDEFLAYDSIFNNYTKEYLLKRDKILEDLYKKKNNNQSLFSVESSFSLD